MALRDANAPNRFRIQLRSLAASLPRPCSCFPAQRTEENVIYICLLEATSYTVRAVEIATLQRAFRTIVLNELAIIFYYAFIKLFLDSTSHFSWFFISPKKCN